MPFSREEIAELMIGQVYDHMVALENRTMAHIEREFDDEGTTDFLSLDRWQDRRVPQRGTQWMDFCPIELNPWE